MIILRLLLIAFLAFLVMPITANIRHVQRNIETDKSESKAKRPVKIVLKNHKLVEGDMSLVDIHCNFGVHTVDGDIVLNMQDVLTYEYESTDWNPWSYPGEGWVYADLLTNDVTPTVNDVTLAVVRVRYFPADSQRIDFPQIASAKVTLKYDPKVISPTVVRHSGLCKLYEGNSDDPYGDELVSKEGMVTATITCPEASLAILNNDSQLLFFYFQAISAGDTKLRLDPDHLIITSVDGHQIPVQVSNHKIEAVR